MSDDARHQELFQASEVDWAKAQYAADTAQNMSCLTDGQKEAAAAAAAIFKQLYELSRSEAKAAFQHCMAHARHGFPKGAMPIWSSMADVPGTAYRDAWAMHPNADRKLLDRLIEEEPADWKLREAERIGGTRIDAVLVREKPSDEDALSVRILSGIRLHELILDPPYIGMLRKGDTYTAYASSGQVYIEIHHARSPKTDLYLVLEALDTDKCRRCPYLFLDGTHGAGPEGKGIAASLYPRLARTYGWPEAKAQ